MAKIFQLDDALANKIAAGEVVERPASVVKELVENAIDAGSTVIEIEIEEAGLSKIRIIDNGAGIEPDDVLTAFQRHATSKIKNESDLFRIRTLGFRGEALPSIASVSRLEIKTSTGNEAGTRLVIDGGKIESHEKASSRKGTDITVSDLFFNTPARLKYMKTIHTELGNITDVVNRIALSHPEIAFKLIHNDRKIFSSNGNGDVRQVLAAIYGMSIVKMMVPIGVESLDYNIIGYVSLPEVTRASRNYISTMINGRYIKNYALARAIQEGYHTLLPIGRYPIVYLNIEMDPILVDVNVHPSKMEVRISKEQELNEMIINAIKSCFKSKTLIPTGAPIIKPERPKSEQTELLLEEKPVRVEREYTSNSSISKEPISFEVAETRLINEKLEDIEDVTAESINFQQKDNLVPVEDFNVETIKERVPMLFPIGQMHGTYILAQNEKGLYIIDQHAAQERIKYEYFREKVGQVANELQDMLVPLTFEYPSNEYLKIMEHRQELETVGVFVEEFGPNSFIVRAHPQWFPKGIEKEIIEEMIEQVLEMKKADVKKLREEAAIMMSCKASIKANHHLRQDEMVALINDLRNSSDPFTCPHGRPIIIHYSTYEMEKMFKRVM
ncbi:DNA mismatch repair endonuclease MutL [Pseudoneobacillus sp. C159]